jgi:hypothetical protein
MLMWNASDRLRLILKNGHSARLNRKLLCAGHCGSKGRDHVALRAPPSNPSMEHNTSETWSKTDV